MPRGRVLLVGAGPGDPGLLTLRAAVALGEADVLVYEDHLGPELLQALPRRARRHVIRGKASAVSALVRYARRGLTVARLHVGDPFLFGSGSEEAEALARAGIPCEIIPGVSSATAAPAEFALPLTRAHCAQGVLVLPGREGRDVDWAHAAAFDGTLLLMMSATSLRENCARLAALGKDPRTPAAVVERGTWPDSRLVTGTLKSLPARAARARVRSPAIVIVGDVVRHARKPRRNIPRRG